MHKTENLARLKTLELSNRYCILIFSKGAILLCNPLHYMSKGTRAPGSSSTAVFLHAGCRMQKKTTLFPSSHISYTSPIDQPRVCSPGPLQKTRSQLRWKAKTETGSEFDASGNTRYLQQTWTEFPTPSYSKYDHKTCFLYNSFVAI